MRENLPTRPLATFFYASLALIAFAGNSVLCRLALADGAIDPSSFTTVRLLAGAVTLLALLSFSRAPDTHSRGSWVAGVMLFTYAALFSFAYVSIDTGVGALILFGSVQISMIVIGLVKGNRLILSEWFGFVLACAGFVYLLKPELSKPSLSGFILMSIAGIAWAGYTLKGQGSRDALRDTTYNFARSLPLLILLLVPFLGELTLTYQGVYYAVLSGALTSGLGYAIWYLALRGLTTMQAGVIQLSVPVIAAIGGVVFSGETISARLLGCTAMVLGGILLVLVGRQVQQFLKLLRRA